MIRTLVSTAFAGLLLAGCNMPQPAAPAATATASAAPTGQNCKKLVQDTGSKIMERKTVCDHGEGAGALEAAMRNSSQGVAGNK
jgi:hypothetical protein